MSGAKVEGLSHGKITVGFMIGAHLIVVLFNPLFGRNPKIGNKDFELCQSYYLPYT